MPAKPPWYLWRAVRVATEISGMILVSTYQKRMRPYLPRMVAGQHDTMKPNIRSEMESSPQVTRRLATNHELASTLVDHPPHIRFLVCQLPSRPPVHMSSTIPTRTTALTTSCPITNKNCTTLPAWMVQPRICICLYDRIPTWVLYGFLRPHWNDLFVGLVWLAFAIDGMLASQKKRYPHNNQKHEYCYGWYDYMDFFTTAASKIPNKFFARRNERNGFLCLPFCLLFPYVCCFMRRFANGMVWHRTWDE